MSWIPELEAFSDEEDDEQMNAFSGRDAVIFLIDCSISMFTKFNDVNEYDETIETSNFTKCLKCVEALMLNRIIGSEKDLVGVVFYNTEKSPECADDDFEVAVVTPANAAIFIGMKSINSDTIRLVMEMGTSEDFSAYGHSADSANFDDIMWLCLNMLNRSGYKLRASTIVLFTDNDEPVPQVDMQKVMKKAKDLNQRGVDFKLMPMKESFNCNLFYKEFICSIMDQDPETFKLLDVKSSQDNMLRRIFGKDYRQKVLAHLNVEIGEIQFSIGLYNYTRKTKIPKAHNLMRETNEKIITKRSYKYCIHGDSMSDDYLMEVYLTPNLTRKYQKLGGERIYFSNLEMYRMKQIFDPSLKILGFKPASALSVKVHIKAPLFCYPDESRIKNSTILFRALWQKCLDKDKIIIAILTQRKRTFPRLVALVPQRGECDLDGFSIRFNGFRVEFIPYAGDVRKLKAFDRPVPETNAKACDVLTKLVKKLKFNYSPTQFENPVIHTIYNKIEEIEFNTQNQIEDCTLPNIEVQDAKIGPFVEQLNVILGDLMLQEPPKRKARSQAGSKPKMPKPDFDANSILTSIRENNTNSITVAMLKSYSTDLGIKCISKLKKNEIIDKIKEHHGIE